MVARDKKVNEPQLANRLVRQVQKTFSQPRDATPISTDQAMCNSIRCVHSLDVKLVLSPY